MRTVVAFFIRYPVWTNVLMITVFGFGIFALLAMKYSFFPETEPNQITVQVAYPGASPEEVSEGVVLKIEENVDGIEGVERVTSVSRENSGTVTVETSKDADLAEVLADVKNAVDRINSFPQGSEKPVVFEQKFRRFALSVVLYGETDLFNLKHLAELLRDDILASPDVSQVELVGLPNPEISIDVAEADLRRYQLSFAEISEAVRNANINISGGKFETGAEEILIRANGRSYYANELQDLVVRGNPDGTVIRLGEIADIREQWEDVPDRAYYDNRTAVVLNISKTSSEDILLIAEVVKEHIAEFNDANAQVQALVIDDQTIPLMQRIELLVDNGIIGLALVLLTLTFFMNLRIAGWVSLGIPFSFAGMFIVALFSGITVNVISLFGMIIVIGILVDDAIVVGENIYAHYERGSPPLTAAIVGTMEVVGPVTTSIVTTVFAFMPFFFLDGFLGGFIWHMAVVVVASLIWSLVEAFFVLPAHLAHSKGLHPHSEDNRVRKAIERSIQYFTHRIYGPTLRFALKHRYAVLATPIALFFITRGLILGGYIGVTIFPFIDGDTLPINISLVSGRQEADTDSILAHIERECWQINEEIKQERQDGRDVVIGIRRDVGSNDFNESGSHTGKLTLLLLDGEERNMDSPIIANRIRKAVGPVPDAQNISFGRFGFFGKPVSVSLLGNDLDQLARARDMLVDSLSAMTVLKDVTESNQKGRREINIELKPRAHALGLTLQDVAGQVRQGFFGQEIQRIQRGRDEIRVWVRYRDEDRAAIGFLDRMRIRSAGGDEYPFSELASYSVERGINAINHLDRMREIKVEAGLTDVNADLPPILNRVQQEIVPAVLERVPNVRASFEGQSRDQAKTQRSMRAAFPLAFIGIIIVIILVFRSYLQAALVIGLIPFGVLGAAWGHGIIGIQLNMLSIYGIIALSGIVVNDSIVFIDKINRNLKNGSKVLDAVFNAGLSRLRPILLTTMTTSLGLAPIIGETSRQAQFLIPMAVSVAFGLVFGTVLLLVVLPAGFMAMNDLRLLSARIRRKDATRESVEPTIREDLPSKSAAVPRDQLA